MTGPLGKYSQVVAALIAIGTIGTALIMHAAIVILGLSVPEGRTAFVDNAALIALGAVFGAVAAVNGVKPSITAAHKRLDSIHAPPAEAVKVESIEPSTGEPTGGDSFNG